jgi:hypothetical protein
MAAAGLSLPPCVRGAWANGGPSLLMAAVVRLRPIFTPGILWRWRPDAGSSLARLDLVNSVG